MVAIITMILLSVIVFLMIGVPMQSFSSMPLFVKITVSIWKFPFATIYIWLKDNYPHIINYNPIVPLIGLFLNTVFWAIVFFYGYKLIKSKKWFSKLFKPNHVL